ncbi:MAG: LysM peptidoglycan-binding domain-containing protein [Geobacteraceae bacterium]|nr:LysM peptidoglycan-binding domain-containing protein [Geobacteraceae bacterium]
MYNDSTSRITAPDAKPPRRRSTSTGPGLWVPALVFLWALCGCSAPQTKRAPASDDAPSYSHTCVQNDTDASGRTPAASKTESPATPPAQGCAEAESRKKTEERHVSPGSEESIPRRDIPAAVPEADTSAPDTTTNHIPEQSHAEEVPVPAPSTSAQPPQPPETILHYTVKGGENMYTIARQPFIYADGMLWPLIYGANRDQIKDPRQIYPGQILNIPRDISEKDMEQARTRAKESSIFTSEEEARSKK